MPVGVGGVEVLEGVEGGGELVAWVGHGWAFLVEEVEWVVG